MKPAIIFFGLVIIGLSSAPARAAMDYGCRPGSCYNWEQIRQQNEIQRQRGLQQHRRVCQGIKSSGRTILWSGC
jgi:hypothetical protein